MAQGIRDLMYQDDFEGALAGPMAAHDQAMAAAGYPLEYHGLYSRRLWK